MTGVDERDPLLLHLRTGSWLDQRAFPPLSGWCPI